MPGRPRPLSAIALAALLGAVPSCSAGPAQRPPRTEFIVAAGDTSVWVRTGPDVGESGIEVRRAPIVLALVDGRFRELYVTEDDYSFHDALFAAQTVWSRDLVDGDSTVVHGDPTAPSLALEYGRRHGLLPLAPDEEGAEEPTVMGVTEAYVVDVHGPLLTVETFADLHPAEGEASHDARLRVVDMRRGAAVALAEVLGDSLGARVVARGRAAHLRAARPPGAAEHLAAVFDERSFTFAGSDAEPAVVFHVPARGVDDADDPVPLPPIPVPAGDWWADAGRSLPGAGPAGRRGVARAWARSGARLEAEPGPDGDRLVLRDSAGRAWPLGEVGGEARRVYWLDAGLDAAVRSALSRAFHEATLHDGTVRTASYRVVARRRDQTPITLQIQR